MTKEYSNYLAHYGVKGQKWGTRQWQNADGSYTEAGKHHYGWGYGRQNKTEYVSKQQSGPPKLAKVDGYKKQKQPIGTRSLTGRQKQIHQPTPEEIEARKARTKTILKIAAGTAIAAGLTYAGYKGYQQSTKLRDSMRSDVFKNFDTDSRNLHTLSSKYWDSADRKKYSEMTAQRAKDVAGSITRTDAVAAKFAEKTGLRISVPKSREKVLAQRRSENQYANFIRSAEKRGAMNKSIHDARAELRAAQKKLTTYQNTQRMGVSKQYESLWTQKHQASVDAARERLDNLLLARRKAG